jgi:DNA invertase Pin-like site-specific DNA recombinase
MTNQPKKAALYARISQAAEDVDKTANQLAELRDLAKASGYVVADEFEDDDVSAYEGKAERADFVRLLVAVQDGHFDVVMATEPQRLTRGSATELEALQLACAKGGAVIHTRAQGVQDPATPGVVAIQRIQDAVSWLEIATMKERQRARNRADRTVGLPSKGVRPFGWEAERRPLPAELAERYGWEAEKGWLYVPLRESEAEIIRAAYRWYMEDGASLRDIARRWTAQGIKTDKMGGTRKDRARPGETKPVPAVWVASTVRQVLTRARNAGILMSGGVEMPVSRIEPIMSRADLDTIRKEIARRAEIIAPGPGPKARSLLAGILECACGERMHATISYSQRKGGPRNVYRIYKCRNVATDKARKHSSVNLALADDAVTLRVLHRVYAGGSAIIDRAEWTAAMGALSERYTASSRNIGHLRALTLDPDTSRADLAFYQGQLRAAHAEREALDAERDRLNAGRAEGGALAELVSAWQGLPTEHRSASASPLPTWRETLWLVAGVSVWERLDLDKRREIVRGMWRVRVSLGGRGTDRLVFRRVGAVEESNGASWPVLRAS